MSDFDQAAIIQIFNNLLINYKKHKQTNINIADFLKNHLLIKKTISDCKLLNINSDIVKKAEKVLLFLSKQKNKHNIKGVKLEALPLDIVFIDLIEENIMDFFGAVGILLIEDLEEKAINMKNINDVINEVKNIISINIGGSEANLFFHQIESKIYAL